MLLLLDNLPLEAVPVDALFPVAVELDPEELDVAAVLIPAVVADPVIVPVGAALAIDAAAVAAITPRAADVYTAISAPNLWQRLKPVS